jgi:putative nucleotidyltransferase with HDIG domain
MSPDPGNENPRKRVSIDEVRIGMYLEDVCTDRGVLLISNHIAISTQSQIDGLKKRGVTAVTINIKKGRDVDSAPLKEATVNISGDDESRREAAYYKELDNARAIHLESVSTATKLLKTIRATGEVQLKGVRKTAEDMAGSVLRNADALISLTQIKGFDEYTYTHSVNVGILMTSLAKEMGYEGETLVEIGMGGLLHDIGKMKVPESILNKPGKLTDGEFAVIKRHPEFGLEMVSGKSSFPDICRKVIGQHHERFNGKGYPLGLSGVRIHEVSLIAAVADVYDALTSDRVYKEAWTPQKALAVIFQGCDSEYSRKIVELFTRHMGIFPVGSFIRLINGEMGIVTKLDRGHLLAPQVLILFDSLGRPMSIPKDYDLLEKQKGADGETYKIEVSLNPKSYGITISNYLSPSK